ncbi:MAG: hypothetical protein WBC13_05765 [Dokdonella sp.]|jgi:general secretion pathway protein N|uniref:hypothetical protein n=1 Tax=Dokdonella sp. TaxID=2291710 RepID=UPI001B45D66D|nr:hypothetical protein [Dokdonella sp.]MCC6439056.1 hypothetical protein [Rhodanobacteraceae bacterium]MBK8124469.1 hypothetical protein [Dokdonella sp.]MBP6326825.1 hypothetical protein [Dokdonella sp.]MBP6328423.1 hypothetical protein [Dokdonella sp.]HNV08170.1 hypothetical protein [Dokdonella sp.]
MEIRHARNLTLGLAGICGALVLAALVQLAGYGRGYGWLPADAAGAPELLGDIDREPFRMPPRSGFGDVETRPLFNEDRKPTPVGDGDLTAEAPPAAPLNATLTGVILVRKTQSTGELRIAMVRDNLRNETVALKVGMPLQGDQAGWTLVDLQPRLAKFRNASDETAEIELNTAAGPAQAPPAPRAPAEAPVGRGQVAPPKAGNPAETDLAKRIEERRRQMREEAERLRAQRGNSPAEQKN